MTRFALLSLIVLLAVGCGGSTAQGVGATGSIAFIRESQLWVMRADGSGQRALPTGRYPKSPAWSPDGRTIAFSAWDKDTYSDVYAILADGSGRRRLTRIRVDAVEPVWSPDGRRIAVDEYYDGTYAIYVIDANGRGERRVTPGYRFTGPPTWSRDGRRIAFTHLDTGDVYVMNRDGSGLRVLARAKTARNIAWSPDGHQIAFTDDGVWMMNSDGSGRRVLVTSPADGIAWSPDSRTIAFRVGDEEDAEIFVVKRDGSALRNLTENTDADLDPVWSSDGRAIAFTSTRDGNSEIYVMDADGSDQRNVSQSPLEDSSPAWSPTRR
jgi:Tol biopolymer transport system component